MVKTKIIKTKKVIKISIFFLFFFFFFAKYAFWDTFVKKNFLANRQKKFMNT